MDIPLMTGGIAHTAGDLTAGINPLASQLGHLSMQDRAFLDVFNKQEQQELHGGPREGPVDPRGLLGQLEQVKCYLWLFTHQIAQSLPPRETRLGDLLQFGRLFNALDSNVLPKLPTFLVEFWNGVKISQFWSVVGFWAIFYSSLLVTLLLH